MTRPSPDHDPAAEPVPDPYGIVPHAVQRAHQQAGRPPAVHQTSIRKLLIGMGIGVLVLVLLAGGLVFRLWWDRPDRTVVAYLEAIRDGDAAKALSFAEVPPGGSGMLLTDEVLQGMQQAGGISDISVLESSRVHVRLSYKLGGEWVEASYRTAKVDGEWKLQKVAFPLQVTYRGSKAPLVVNGVAVGDTKDLMVFPGIYELGSGTDRIAWSNSPVRLTGDALETHPLVSASATGQGVEDARRAVEKALAQCRKEKALVPAGCPFGEERFAGTVVKSSIRWSVERSGDMRLITDLSENGTMTGSQIQQLRVRFTYRDAGTTKTWDQSQSVAVHFEVDLREKEPTVTWLDRE